MYYYTVVNFAYFVGIYWKKKKEEEVQNLVQKLLHAELGRCLTTQLTLGSSTVVGVVATLDYCILVTLQNDDAAAVWKELDL
jgi:hypothetical protein